MKDFVDFGSQVFKIKIVDKLLVEDGGFPKKVQGRISPNQCLIEIEKNVEPQSQMLTLWHEIIHQIMNRPGHDGEEFINPKMSEAIVENLSEGVMLVLRLNPWLGVIK